MRPQPMPQRGRHLPLQYMPGIWTFQRVPSKSSLNLKSLVTGIGVTQPEGNITVPLSEDMVKDPDLGVIWGNHPSASSEIRTQLRDVVTSHKGKSFAYSVQDLGTYKGEVGDFGIKLHHNHPIMSARRKRSTLEQQIQDDKCAELRDAGLITPFPPCTKYASE